MTELLTLLSIAAQTPDPLSQTDNPLWPYWVAIATLAGAVATLFGVVMKQSSAFAKKLDEIHETHRKLDEERSKRVAEEFSKKDSALLETSVEFAKLMERVANELSTLNERERR